MDNSLIKSKKEYLDNYVLNAIVNHTKNEYKYKKIPEEELIKLIVKTTYNKSKYKNKYCIIKNSLINSTKSNQYINKYKLNQTVKNINYELDEVVKEFDKLFENAKNYNTAMTQ